MDYRVRHELAGHQSDIRPNRIEPGDLRQGRSNDAWCLAIAPYIERENLSR
jgi:hypothetical protein